MYISDKMIKKAGLFPSGKYDAVIKQITERYVADDLGESHLCWFFYIDLLKDEKWYPYVYCMKSGASHDPEYLDVFEDLLEATSHRFSRSDILAIKDLCVSIKLDCTIDTFSPFFRIALMRNVILKIEKTDIDKSLLDKRKKNKFVF